MKCPICTVLNSDECEFCTQCGSDMLIHHRLLRFKEIPMSQPLETREPCEAPVKVPSLSFRPWLLYFGILQALSLMALLVLGVGFYFSWSQLSSLQIANEQLLAKQKLTSTSTTDSQQAEMEVMSALARTLEKTTEMYAAERAERVALTQTPQGHVKENGAGFTPESTQTRR